MATALEGGEGSASRLGRSLPSGNTRCPLYRRLGGPQGRSGQVQKSSPPPGFDPRIVQPVASRYTDNATRPFRSPILEEYCCVVHMLWAIVCVCVCVCYCFFVCDQRIFKFRTFFLRHFHTPFVPHTVPCSTTGI